MQPNNKHWYDYVIILILLGITGYFVTNVVIGLFAAQSDESGLTTAALIVTTPIAIALLYASFSMIKRIRKK